MPFENPQPGQELVRAITLVDHDRKARVPDTESAIFPVATKVAEQLEALGAIVRGDLVLQAASADTSVIDAASDLVIKPEVPLFDANSTLAALADAQGNVETLSQSLQESQANVTELAQSLVETRDELAARQSDLVDLTAKYSEAQQALEASDADLQSAQAQIAQLNAQPPVAGSGDGASDTGAAPGGAAETGDGASADTTAKAGSAKGKKKTTPAT